MMVKLFYPFKFSLLFLLVRGYVPTSTATSWFAKPSLDAYVEDERTRSDTRSLPYLRETQLYSRSSQGHLRILGRKVDAVGKDGDVYAKLIIESDNFGRVKIRGAKTSYYLCVRKKDGRLVGRQIANTSKSKCIFYEKYATNFFTEFTSAFRRKWMITVSKKGFTRPSFKGKTGSRSVQFIQRPSRFIIETESVGPSFVDGLTQHIAKLLRAFRTRAKGVGNSDSTTARASSKKKKIKKRKRPLTPKEKRRKQRRKNKRRLRKKLKRLQKMKKLE